MVNGLPRRCQDAQLALVRESTLPHDVRAAIAAKLRDKNRIPAREEDVIILNGGMQGLFGAFQSTVNPGDEVLLLTRRFRQEPLRSIPTRANSDSARP